MAESIPEAERRVLRTLAGPVLLRLPPPGWLTRRIQGQYAVLGKRIEKMDTATFARRRTIKRFPGLEPSSLDWSPRMICEHLLYVGKDFLRIIRDLEATGACGLTVSTAAVKPRGEMPDAWDKLRAHGREYVAEARARNWRGIAGKHAHPWFGPLSARRWHGLYWVHLRLHMRQLERVLED